MSLVSKLLGIWMVRRTVSSTTPLFIRLLLGVVALTISAVVVALLGALLLSVLLWFLYSQLIEQGFGQGQAQLMIAGLIIAMMLGFVALIQSHWRNVRKVSNSLIYMTSPTTGVSGRFAALSDAFMQGFHTPAARVR